MRTHAAPPPRSSLDISRVMTIPGLGRRVLAQDMFLVPGSTSRPMSYEDAVRSAVALSKGRDKPPAVVLRSGNEFVAAATRLVTQLDEAPWAMEGLKPQSRPVHAFAEVVNTNLAAVVDGAAVERLPDYRRVTLAAMLDAPLAQITATYTWHKNVGTGTKPEWKARTWTGPSVIHAEAARSADTARGDIPFRALGMDEPAAFERFDGLLRADRDDRAWALVRDESGAHYAAPVGSLKLPGDPTGSLDVVSIDRTHPGVLALASKDVLIRTPEPA